MSPGEAPGLPTLLCFLSISDAVQHPAPPLREYEEHRVGGGPAAQPVHRTDTRVSEKTKQAYFQPTVSEQVSAYTRGLQKQS